MSSLIKTEMLKQKEKPTSKKNVLDIVKNYAKKWPPQIFYLKLKYFGRPHKKFYAAWMNYHAKSNPKATVGGMWEEIGKLQFGFLLENGLSPDHQLLDLGCGCLRGGIHFISYLKAGNYFGMDISEEILKAGKKILRENHLEDKHPILIHNTDLSFEELQGKQFDFIIAQSVFTHIPLSDIEECFQNVKKILKNNGVFFATFFESSTIKTSKTGLTFHYPFRILREVANKYGLKIEKLENFKHPRGQKMLKITRNNSRQI